MKPFARLRLPLLMVALIAYTQPAMSRSLPDFTDLVKQVSSAVVNISTTSHAKKNSKDSTGKRGGQFHGFPEGTPFDDLLKKFFQERGEEGDFTPDKQSLGSGFIISKDGYLLTNRHVVKDADEIIVRLSDRREFKAELIGMDKRSDLALLKIDDENLPVVKIGKSSKLEAGEWVLAIGSPFGFEHSVTAGIVSATGRSLPNENYVPFIQTDVAINPGNSGGPLFNMDGEVVGINSQIFSRTGGYMGLSFAIPVDVAMRVADELKNTGHVTRGWLGVYIQDVTRDLALSFGMKQPQGALVTRVIDDSPAAKAGIKVGDVIIEYDGNLVPNSSALPPMVGMTALGNAVPVKVIRNSKKKNLKVVIAELPDSDTDSMQEKGDSGDHERQFNGRMGLFLEDLTSAQRKKLGIDSGGVLVTQVKQGAAGQAGIRRGDVILMVNGQHIESVRALNRIVDNLAAGSLVPVLVQRDGGALFMPMQLPEE